MPTSRRESDKSATSTTQRRPRMSRRYLVPPALALLVFISARPIAAATIQSNGTGGGSWTTGSSWQGGVAPVSADDVVILDGDAINVLGGTSVTRTGTTSINVMSVSGYLRLVSTATFINQGTMNVDGDIWMDSSSTLINQGAYNNRTTIAYRGVVRNEVGGTINVLGTMYIEKTLENDGTVYVLSSATGADSRAFLISIYNGVILNKGSITVDGNYGWFGCYFGGTVQNSGTLTFQSGAVVIARSIFANSGVINNAGIVYLDGLPPDGPSGGFSNEEDGTINNNSGGQFQIYSPNALVNKGIINNYASFIVRDGCFLSNSSGHFTVAGAGVLEIRGPAGAGSVGATFSNGFCGRLTNNNSIVNNGLLSNCGLIDGTTGVGGITGSGVLDTTSCGGGTPNATLTVQVRDAVTTAALPAAEVYVERVCLPMGTRVPFLDVSGGAARYFLGALEPAQYEIKVFAPGYAPMSGRVVVIQSGPHIENVALTPDATAVNTIKVDINVGTGGNLVTDNFQVTQDAGTPFQPTVAIDGLTMKLVGLKAGVTSAQALVEGFSVDPVSTTFSAIAPGVYEASAGAVSVSDSGTASGGLVFASAPPSVVGFQINFTKMTTGASIVVPSSNFSLVGTNPMTGATTYSYVFELNVGDYYVVASNSGNTITSGDRLEVTIAPLPAITIVPNLNITLPADDTDGDDLPDWWENAKNLNASSAAPPNGSLDDKEPDGLTNIEEFTLDIHPGMPDTDSDTYPDGFERFVGSNPKVNDTPPLFLQVYVRYGFTDVIRIGSIDRPVATFGGTLGAKDRIANGGTITIQNTGTTTLAEPGALTLGQGFKSMTLRLADPAGPKVRLGSAN